MDCKKYKKFELGKIREEEFNKHLINCHFCQESKNRDDLILREAKKLKRTINAPYLWERISEDLQYKGQKKGRIIPFNRLLILSLSTKTVASLSCLVILGVYLLFFVFPKSDNLLGESAFKRVQKIEKEYITAIFDLERAVCPKMQKVNIELSLKYKDRLQIIDEQIRICQEELKTNPVNTHIRRYLLTALQDKKETLIEMNQLRHSNKL